MTTDTRARILEAAARVFAEKGYHETRMDDIVAASSASKGSLYFHFPNKEEIFFGLIETFTGLLEARLRRLSRRAARPGAKPPSRRACACFNNTARWQKSCWYRRWGWERLSSSAAAPSTNAS